MTAASAAARGQRLAASLMEDACTITRDGIEHFDAATGEYSSGETTIYSGACRVRPASLADQQVEAGEGAVQVWPFAVSVPLSATGIRPGDKVTVTASLDDDLVDRVFLIKEAAIGTHITARRLGCDLYQAASSG